MSKIEWTDETWNPLTGCTKVSPGCDHCYAKTMHERFNGQGSFDTVTLHPERLDQPLRWRKPRKVFVNSMSDLFHQDVPDEFIARVFAVMYGAPQHTFQVLTKRHARMRSLLSRLDFPRMVMDAWVGPQWEPLHDAWYPLRNVWLGVSVENQQWADIRIPALLDMPAAVRFLSCEPLLGPVDLVGDVHAGHESDDVNGYPHPRVCLTCSTDDDEVVYFRRSARNGIGVDWVIVGGESGPGARPMQGDWARSIRDQCNTAGVPYLFKQWGSHDEHGKRMSKHNAGRLLDGRTWDEYPDSVAAHSLVGHQKESA